MYESARTVVTVSTPTNWLSRPRLNNIKKNMNAQNGAPGIFLIPSGYAMKARPGPDGGNQHVFMLVLWGSLHSVFTTITPHWDASVNFIPHTLPLHSVHTTIDFIKLNIQHYVVLRFQAFVKQLLLTVLLDKDMIRSTEVYRHWYKAHIDSHPSLCHWLHSTREGRRTYGNILIRRI